MSSAQFDPCKQWLGIDAVELGDPRRVLGLLPSEADPLVVLRAADARITLLRSIAPGPFDMARNALIKRVEESREAVLTQIASAPKPPVPVGTTFAMPPAPAGAGAAQMPPIAIDPAEPAFPMAGSPWGETAAHDGGDRFAVNVKTRNVYRKQLNTGVFLLLIGTLAAAAGGLVWYQKDKQPFNTLLSQLGIGTPKAATKDEASSEPLLWPKPAQDVVAATSPDAPSAGSTVDTGTMDGIDQEPFVALLEQAVTALQAQRFDDADETLLWAGEKAVGIPAHSRLAQWRALANYAKRFADHRDRALDAKGAEREYEIDGKRLAIVEIDDEEIVYRYAGRNKTLSRSRIPDKLLLAILQGWLNRKPANHLYLGAYHATKPEPDLEKARHAWQLAERGGADASELLPLLDDPVLLKAAEAAADRDDQ